MLIAQGTAGSWYIQYLAIVKIMLQFRIKCMHTDTGFDPGNRYPDGVICYLSDFIHAENAGKFISHGKTGCTTTGFLMRI